MFIFQTRQYSGSSNFNLGGTSSECTYENALYEEPSVEIKTAKINDGYETPQYGHFNMEDASTSSARKGKLATVPNFQNPLFPEMSAQRNMNLYS